MTPLFSIRTLPTLLILAGLFSSAPLVAQSIFVTDQWRFEMRDSPCFECKILVYGIDSGTEMTLVGEETDKWIKVRTPGGTEGWMPKNYLSDQPSAKAQLESIQKDAQVSSAEAGLLRNQIEILTTDLREAGIELELVELTDETGTTKVTVPAIMGNLATLGTQNEELSRRNQMLQNELDLQSAQINRLQEDQFKRYFIYGAGAVIAGVLLCLIVSRARPKRGYSEWR